MNQGKEYLYKILKEIFYFGLLKTNLEKYI